MFEFIFTPTWRSAKIDDRPINRALEPSGEGFGMLSVESLWQRLFLPPNCRAIELSS